MSRTSRAGSVAPLGAVETDGLVLLVAEDDAAVREVCRDVAESLRLSVLEASTAARAEELADGGSVDVVLADLRLPDASGMKLL